MKYKYETHVHTKEGSACGKNTAREMVKIYSQAGYAGFVITDHFIHGSTAVPKDLAWNERMQMYYDAYLEAKDEGDKIDFDVLFGFEHHYGNGKEVLVYGVDLEFLQFHPELETADIDTFSKLVHEANGILVHAHPYRKRKSIPEGFCARLDVCDGVEVYNTHDAWDKQKIALEDAVFQNKLMFSGGDTHRVEDERIGNAGLVFEKRIRNGKDFVATIQQGEYSILIEGEEYSLKQAQALGKNLAPAVFVVNKTYQIIQYTLDTCEMWVQIGAKCYYAQSNAMVHKVEIPMSELDAAKKYTVFLRKSHGIETVETYTYEFCPVTGKEAVRAYHVADVHSWLEGALTASALYENIDFLILNGDIQDYNEDTLLCSVMYRLLSSITGGNIPVIFACGNQDIKGVNVENFAEYTPTDCGRSYYTFRMGDIWGLVLDCGEDHDRNICWHQFRQNETLFIKEIIARAKNEYQEAGVAHRVVIGHYPFSLRHFKLGVPSNIEGEIYREWTELLNTYIRPDIMISAHTHHAGIVNKGDELDLHGLSCPVVIGADVKKKEPKYFAGAGLEFSKEGIKITYTDCLGKTII